MGFDGLLTLEGNVGDACPGADVHHAPSRFDQQIAEGLHHPQRAPVVDFEQALRGVDVHVQRGHDELLSCVVDKDIQAAACALLNCRDDGSDGGGIDNVELEDMDVGERGQLGHLLEGARGRKDGVAALLEGEDEGWADAAGATAGDEDGFSGHGDGYAVKCWVEC